MKYTFFLLLAFSSFAHAASDWQLAASAATSEYQKDYKSEKGMEAEAPLGLFLVREEEELISKVYYSEGNKLLSFTYGCHLHSAEEFDCHKEDRADHGGYTRLGNAYNTQALVESIPAALEVFTRKLGPESLITSMKLWQAEDLIRFVISYEKNGPKKDFLACHFHGGTTELDCHRKSSAGPGEPEKL